MPRATQYSVAADSEPLQQSFQIFEFDARALLFAEALAQFLENLTSALRVDLVGHPRQQTWIGAVGGALRRAPERIELTWIPVRTAAFAPGLLTLLHHLLGHVARALAKLIEGALLCLHCPLDVAVAQRPLGFVHGAAGIVELLRRLHAHATHAALQAVQPLT